MKHLHARTTLVLFLLAALLGAASIYAQAPAKPAAPQQPADEFGIPLGDTPPPMPPGYASQNDALVDVLSGKVEAISLQGEIPVPEGVVESKDIEYGKVGDRALLLNLYTPEKLEKPAPGLIFIHGGGWTSGNRNDYKYYTVRYAKRGFVVATISYRFAQEAHFPAALQDAKCAVRWMRENAEKYHVDPNHIGVIGGSAGGHLAMMVGYTPNVPEFEGDGGHAGVSSRVQAVVNFYGPSELDSDAARKADVVKKFLGKTFEEDPEIFTKASPMHYLTKDAPPTLIFHGTIDELVPVAQSDRLAEKLKGLGVPCVYEKFPGWPHTMDLAVPVNKRCQYFMNRFFAQHLQGSKSSGTK
jgi:acetyl esterase/lipase